MRKVMGVFFITAVLSFFSYAAGAQFSGPSAGGEQTVAQAFNVRIGSSVTLRGNIIEHIRGNYYTFRDSTGSIKVEIPAEVWQGRGVNPETVIRINGEVDRSVFRRYIWVKSLSVQQ